MLEFTEACPGCAKPWDERSELIGRRAGGFESCAFRCEACGIGYSNATAPADRRRITRTPELNVPPEVGAGLSAALEGAANVRNREQKRIKFCSASSEDAVTWAVVHGLAESGDLGSLTGARHRGDPDAVLLWGHPVSGPRGPEVARRLTSVCDALGEYPNSRTEPDVVVLWTDLMLVVEAKYGSGNDDSPDDGGYPTYLRAAAGLFAVDDRRVAGEGSYQLARNWVVGTILARELGVRLALVNLAPPRASRQAARFAAIVHQSPERSFEHRTWRAVLDASSTPAWLEAFAAERSLHRS